MHRAASLDPASTPSAWNSGPNRATCNGPSVRADGVQCLVPGGQHFPGGRVQVGAEVLIPDRQLVAVEAGDLGGGPPDLVVGGGDHLAKHGPGHGAADGHVQVRGQPPCGSTAPKYCAS